MKTPAQRGAVGNWLRAERIKRDWDTARKALHQLKLAGIDIHESVYREWESGARLPADDRLNELVAFYGTSPFADQAQPEDLFVAAAIDRQTEAIREQTAMLEAVLTAIALPRMTDDDRRWIAEQVAASKE